MLAKVSRPLHERRCLILGVSVCPNCGHHFKFTTTPYISETAAKLNEAIEKAVETRIRTATSGEEYKVLHRRFRMWLAKDLRESLGFRWQDVTNATLESALRFCEEWAAKYS
jgi:hypothetical protein